MLVASAAQAAPGDHIRVGQATITPSLMTGFEAQSNVYLSDGGAGSSEVPGLAWQLKPKLSLELTNKTVALNLGAGYGLKKFIDFTPDDDFNAENADQFANFEVDGNLLLFPQGRFGMKLTDKLQNEALPAELPTGTGTANITHTGNDLSGGLVIRPGSALNIEVLGQVGFDDYLVPSELVVDDDGVTVSTFNNRLQYGPVVNGTWRFLPKTSALASFSYNFLRWENNIIEALGPDVEGSPIGAFIGKPDADAWRAQVGINGLFTSKLSATAQVGFGMMTYDEASVTGDPAAGTIPNSSAELDLVGDENFATDTSAIDGLLLNLQVSYAPVRGQTLTAGYRKDFQDAIFTNYVAYNSLFLRYEGSFQNRLGLGAEVGYRVDSFHGEVARSDQNLNFRGSAAYKLTPWMSTGASVSWMRRACLDTNCEGTFYSTQYDNVIGNLGFTFTY